MSRPAAVLRPAVALAFIAATLLPYVGGGWVSDDFVHVTRLDDVRSVAELFAAPDAFGFYRPLPQISLWLQGAALGYVPAMFRTVNVVLHVAVVLMAFAIARQLLAPRAAVYAALAFALTPKAPTVAVLWASARPELLMSVFVLASVWAWMKWQQDHGWWLVVSGLAYVLALLSKESAALLPLVLAVAVPRNATITRRQRVMAACALTALAALPLLLRVNAGALMPASTHEQYSLDLSLYRLWRSLEVYTGRAVTSPLALIVVTSLAALLSARHAAFVKAVWRRAALLPVAVVSIVWFIALMAPVFPIAARQELYLYLPVLGLCLVAGAVAEATVAHCSNAAAAVAVGVYVLGFVSYQQIRHADAREVQQFTAALVNSIRDDESLRQSTDEVQFVAADSHSAELMQKGVGGYINGVTVLAIPARTFAASVASGPGGTTANTIRYRFIDGVVSLEH